MTESESQDEPLKPRVNRVIRDDILAMAAYPVPPSTGLIKLDAMENPYTLPEELAEKVNQALHNVPLNLYPHPSPESLIARIKSSMGVPEGMDILLGNGSDELIHLITLAAAKPGSVVLSVSPTFVMYRMTAAISSSKYVDVSLTPDLSLDLEAVLKAVQTHKPSLIYLAYPNNPTGVAFPEEAICAIIEKAPGLVVVDEAYHAFAKRTFMQHLRDYPNLLVMRTLSKLGLAGARLGFVAGRPEWIEQINKIRLPYNINVMTQRAVETVLMHLDVLAKQTDQLCQARDDMLNAMRNIEGVDVFPSDANFLLFRVKNAPVVHAELKKHGILIKLLHGGHPLLENCLRVSMGKPEENQQFLTALKESIKTANL